MSDEQTAAGQVLDPTKITYGELAKLAFEKAEIAVQEGAIVIEGKFDHAYGWARGELEKAEAEIDSNALYMALTGHQQTLQATQQQAAPPQQ